MMNFQRDEILKRIEEVKKQINEANHDVLNTIEDGEGLSTLSNRRYDDATALMWELRALSRELFISYINPEGPIAGAETARPVREIPVTGECPRFRVKITIAPFYFPCGECPYWQDADWTRGVTLCDFKSALEDYVERKGLDTTGGTR